MQQGEAGRDRLLQDPDLPIGVKQQIANIPVRAVRDPQLMTGISSLFRDAILAREDSLVAAGVQQSLQTVRASIPIYAAQLVERIQRGTKVAFATAIAHMLERAIWIVALAVIVVLFIPELPLRSRAASAEGSVEPATS